MGNSPVTSKIPTQRSVTRSFDVFFDLRLNKRLCQRWKRRWFETPSHPLWRHCNDIIRFGHGFVVLYIVVVISSFLVDTVAYHARVLEGDSQWAEIWKHRTESTLVQVLDCCVAAPNIYLNQYRPLTGGIHMSVISQLVAKLPGLMS